MRRIFALAGGLMCLTLVLPGCRHTEIHERPVIAQPAPQQPPPTTVIERDRQPDVIIEHR
jgi:hypothetical protein